MASLPTVTPEKAADGPAGSTSYDTTFRAYNETQAASYAAGRGKDSVYTPELYQIILNQHQSTAGQLSVLLDVGCGPGNATRDVAPAFEEAIGVDGSPGMIKEARKLGGETGSKKPIHWAVSDAEDIASLSDLAGKVDLITVAMAAHWFDMPRFWRAAASILKPGGTVALWTCASYYVHPSVPQAAELQKLFSHFEDVVLGPYSTPGNRMSRSLYADLPMPWQADPPVPEFPASADAGGFYKKVWNEGGRCKPDESYFLSDRVTTLRGTTKSLRTASMYTRWMEANGEKVRSGEIRDCIDVLLEQAQDIMGGDPNVQLRSGAAGVLIMVKKA